MIFKRSLILALSLCLVTALAAPAQEWQSAQPEYAWSFPEDHWTRDGYKTEWWYFTGHLTPIDDPSRRLGYQFTFFRVGLVPERPDSGSAWTAKDLIMGHAAITDLRSGRHLFSELVYRAVPFLGGFGRYPDPLIVWSRAPAGTDGKWTLRWNGEAFDFGMRDDAQGMAFELSTRPAKPLVFQGPNGFSRKGAGATAASHYYSFTRLETQGTLWLDGQKLKARGESWMDKEFGSHQLGEKQVGWDWFSLQLDDGREIMLYLLRGESRAVDFARGTLVSSIGDARYLDPKEWSVRSTGTWKSPKTGASYPSRWIIEIPGERIRIDVIPELADQENRSLILPDLFYWEGAVAVSDRRGRRLGRGYVELTGYGKKNRLPI